MPFPFIHGRPLSWPFIAYLYHIISYAGVGAGVGSAEVVVVVVAST